MFTKADIETYYITEKNLGMLFMVISGLAIVAAIVFYFALKTPWHRGAAFSLLLVALFQLSMGYRAYQQADTQRKSAVYAYDMNPTSLKENALPSLQNTNRNIGLFMIIEIILLAAGIVGYLYFRKNEQQMFWAGFGIALAMQAAICLFTDWAAKKNSTQYLQHLQTWGKK